MLGTLIWVTIVSMNVDGMLDGTASYEMTTKVVYGIVTNGTDDGTKVAGMMTGDGGNDDGIGRV
jgi:hypothetical protein